jgi:pyruvate kinase
MFDAVGDGLPTWDQSVCLDLVDRLWQLRQHMLSQEHAASHVLAQVALDHQASARNLLHNLALRQHDHRVLQEQLAWVGVSSLGRAESHVLANLDKVLGILHRLMGQAWHDHSTEEPVGIVSSQRLLQEHTHALLGPEPDARTVRVMVTLPSEAASDPDLVQRLVAAGMDIARINCAHDGAAQWQAMAGHVRRAAQHLGRPVRVLMDLGGPKLRTGQLPSGPAVLKVRPQRDELGRPVAPAAIGLRATGSAVPVPGAQVHVGVKADWVAGLEVGDKIDLVDARDAHRTLRVVAADGETALVHTDQTVYLLPQTRLTRQRHARHAPANTRLNDLPALEGKLHLQRGDRLRVVAEDAPLAPAEAGAAAPGGLPCVPCTLPEVFAQVNDGERIWFDDGRIGGVIRQADARGLVVEITQARDAGEKLLSDKGINLPDSQLDLPALTPKDVDDLVSVARLADMVGLSFVQREQDVEELRTRLAGLGAAHVGVVLKIETRRAFENLPRLMLSAMASPAAGIMIARGDLAVECGYERLAEIQEEILWAAEAAHMPVIWATQVLETLAKTGMPSRAEITDAAMGERAECVMLNKGPHILDAMRTLDDILRRMQAHQSKKRPLLRALGAWAAPV